MRKLSQNFHPEKKSHFWTPQKIACSSCNCDKEFDIFYLTTLVALKNLAKINLLGNSFYSHTAAVNHVTAKELIGLN